ncbi:MAG: type I-E CRISPR-associated protein Cas6/Cse3/CasE [Firmicutes bacterium]|nr:type I-E CRISPR-associated protein Cas6/Cse3/CasE [Dethiobacter sp.]MBS3888430.1 type I-E CRISPR-associated protein Cas6/Cse3/CasE [Bacillota bacterium]MBS4054569.1 type I-E CRISPR-associated protein Cas6/Cse3/CasE [Thermaerobacter sp.]
MYLTRIALDLNRRETLRALASPHVIHGAVESSVPPGESEKRERNLWRIDYLEPNCYLLVLSRQVPNMTAIATQFGYAQREPAWETRCYQTLLSKLHAGQALRFRLRANPVRSSCIENEGANGRGRVYAHVTVEQQKQWLYSRSEGLGFALDDQTFTVVHTEWKKFRKSRGFGNEVSLRIADFEGRLQVTNVELFKHALTQGIGRAKSYGCGLLTVARERELSGG